MKKFLLILFGILIFSSTAQAATIEAWGDNNGGLNILRSGPIAAVEQVVGTLSAAKDTLIAINFPGDDVRGGLAFSFCLENESSVADTLTHYYFAPATSSLTAVRVRADSVKYVMQAGVAKCVNFTMAEGDSVRWNKIGEGNGRLTIAGVKNLRGKVLVDY